MGENTFRAAVQRLCRAIKEGSSEPLPSGDAAIITGTLRAYVRARYPWARHLQDEDVVQQALADFFAAVQDGRVDCDRSPRYLEQIALNRGADELRRPNPEPLESWLEQADDAAAAELESIYAKTDVAAGLRAAWLAGDDLCFRVVSEWLNQAEGGRAPSSRDVARVVGVSHTAVQECVKRFRELYFPKGVTKPY